MGARTGVVVAQLGGPANLAEVKPFIRSIFSDPHLVPLPGGARTRAAVSTLVANVRAPRVRSYYELIGGGSPLVATTQLQASALDMELAARGHDTVVVVAHRHSRPDTGAAVDAMVTAGVGHIVMLPLFPQHSDSTTGSSEAELRQTLSERGIDLPLTVIHSWCQHPSYLAAQTQLVEEMLAEVPDENLSTALLVFSAHGLPQRVVDQGDLYPEEVEATVAGVMSRLQRSVDHVIAYQSRTGPIRWIGPDVREVIATAAADRLKWLGVVPISFVSDHVETLYEIDIEMKDLSADVGIGDFHRSRVLGVDPIVGPMLADIVQDQL